MLVISKEVLVSQCPLRRTMTADGVLKVNHHPVFRSYLPLLVSPLSTMSCLYDLELIHQAKLEVATSDCSLIPAAAISAAYLRGQTWLPKNTTALQTPEHVCQISKKCDLRVENAARPILQSTLC